MNENENKIIEDIIEWVKQNGHHEIKIAGVEKGFLVEMSEGEFKKDQYEITGSIKRTALATSTRRNFFDALNECYNSAILTLKDKVKATILPESDNVNPSDSSLTPKYLDKSKIWSI